MIVVFGGTGRLGRLIVARLRGDGHPVRVVTRDPASAEPVDGTEVVAGDLRDRASLDRAVAGATAIVCTAHGGGGRGADGPGAVEGTGLPQLIEAARDVKQFVYVSAASARADSPVDLFRLKYEVEGRLRASGVPHSILRPTHLMDTWVELLAGPITGKGRAMVLGKGANPVSWVAGVDVARVAAALAARPGEGWTADLGGPEALTLTQVNELVAAAWNVRLKGAKRMPRALLRITPPLLAPVQPVLARNMRMGLLVDTEPQVVNSGPVWRRYGEPCSLPTWLERHHGA